MAKNSCNCIFISIDKPMLYDDKEAFFPKEITNVKR
jgi:hypothetical protein